jgi:hypothetical protein
LTSFRFEAAKGDVQIDLSRLLAALKSYQHCLKSLAIDLLLNSDEEVLNFKRNMLGPPSFRDFVVLEKLSLDQKDLPGLDRFNGSMERREKFLPLSLKVLAVNCRNLEVFKIVNIIIQNKTSYCPSLDTIISVSGFAASKSERDYFARTGVQMMIASNNGVSCRPGTIPWERPLRELNGPNMV